MLLFIYFILFLKLFTVIIYLAMYLSNLCYTFALYQYMCIMLDVYVDINFCCSFSCIQIWFYINQFGAI